MLGITGSEDVHSLETPKKETTAPAASWSVTRRGGCERDPAYGHGCQVGRQQGLGVYNRPSHTPLGAEKRSVSVVRRGIRPVCHTKIKGGLDKQADEKYRG
jgi:hypothetical protein